MSAQGNTNWLREGAHIDEMVGTIQPPCGVTVSQITTDIIYGSQYFLLCCK